MSNYAFIDSQNLNLGVNALGWKLDFRRFRIYLKDKYQVEKAFLFIGYISTQQNLYVALQNFGYILVFKPVLHLGKKIKGNVDAELVLHAMIEFGNYDKAVIVSGDGDFHCLIEHLEKNNKLGKLFVPDKAKYSSLLKRFAPMMAYVSDLKEKLGMK